MAWDIHFLRSFLACGLPRRRVMLFLVLCALAFAPLAAARDRIDCKSSGHKYNECRTPFRAPVLVDQLSMTDCVQGRNWGVLDDDGTVWVDQGCSATFAEGGRGRHGDRGHDDRRDGGIECRSRGYAFERCDARWRGARLVRKLSDSACDEGRGWGVDRDGLWVDNGCAGYFVEDRGRGWRDNGRGNDYGTITCESHGGNSTRCSLPRGTRDVGIDEQLSSAQCRRGDSWDFDGRDIWVASGCRARFRYW